MFSGPAKSDRATWPQETTRIMPKSASIKVGEKAVRKRRGINNDGLPNAAWTRFKSKISKFDSTPVSEWKPYHLLGYTISKLDGQHVWKYTGSPSKCSEMYCINRTISMLDSTSIETAKEYIDFVFSKKIEIRSMALFFSDGLVSEFLKKKKKGSVIGRATVLPSQYVDIIKDSGLQVETWADLAFACTAIKQNPENYRDYAMLIDSLRDIGFVDAMVEGL